MEQAIPSESVVRAIRTSLGAKQDSVAGELLNSGFRGVEYIISRVIFELIYDLG